FQAKYTSEDNESFNTLLDKQNAKRVEKYAWAHNGNKILAPRQIAQRTREQKLLEVSNSKEIVLRPSEDLDERPAQVNTAPSRPKNALMFAPDSIEDTHT